MNYQHKAPYFARMALILSLSLTAACTTIAKAPVEKNAGPMAPGAGFDDEPQAPASAPVAPKAAAEVTATAVETAPTAIPAPAPGRITPRQKYVNVRPDPSANKKPIAVLRGGKKVDVLNKEGAWAKIRWSRGKKVREGWVAGKFVETATSAH